jgi:hypothetical protein
MTPEAALERQIQIYRAMTGEQRLAIALDLHKLSCDIAREGIRHQFPEADEAEVERRLRQRIEAEREVGRCWMRPLDTNPDAILDATDPRKR